MKKIILLSLFLLCGCTNNNQDTDTNTTENRNVKVGMAYHQAHSDDAVCVASVYVENDVILGATLDEITYLSSEEYENLITSEQTTTQKHISSKVENDEAYSQVMKVNGATHTIKENFKAICDYVKGKSISELETELNTKSKEEIVDAVSGCTLQSTDGYLQTILQACNEAK